MFNPSTEKSCWNGPWIGYFAYEGDYANLRGDMSNGEVSNDVAAAIMILLTDYVYSERAKQWDSD